MTDHDDLTASVLRNTAAIGDMKADISYIRATVEGMKGQIGDVRTAIDSLSANTQKTSLKIAELTPVKLVVFGLVGLVLSGFFAALSSYVFIQYV